MRSQAAFWPFAFAGSLALHSALTLAVAGLAHRIEEAPPLAEFIIGEDAPFPAEMLAPSSSEAATAMSATDAATVQPAQSESVAPDNLQAVASENLAAAPPADQPAAPAADNETLSPSAAQEQAAAATAEERIAVPSGSETVAPSEATAVRETPKPAETGLEPEAPAEEANPPIADAAPLKPTEEAPPASPALEGEALAPVPEQAQTPAAAANPAGSALPPQGSTSVPSAPAPPPEQAEMAALPPEAMQAAPEMPQTAPTVTDDTAAAKAGEPANEVPPLPASPQAPAAASRPDSVQPAAPNSAAPASPPATVALQASPSGAAKPAASLTAEPAASESAQQPQLAALPPAALTETRSDRMRRFLRNYESGSGCFFAVPVALDSPRPRIDGFGSRSKPIVDFGEAFERTLGIAPAISVRTITEYQCPAITFIGGLLKSRFPELRVRLERDQIATGTDLRGTIEGVQLRWLYLVLIDDDGMVQDLSQYLSREDGRLTFVAPMYVQGQGRLRNQLLVGVATSKELGLLKTDKPIRAEDFLPAVVDEADRKGADVALGLGAFRVE